MARSEEAIDEEALLARWRADVGWTTSASVEQVFEEVVRRYSEPHRAYHNLQHVGQVLEVVDYLARFAVDLRAVRLAAWFHDIVYDPRSQDNEAASAALASKLLAEIGYTSKAAVAEMIRATRDHDHSRADLDTLILQDADLAILGAPQEVYLAYAAAIRKEYFWVPDVRFYSGRTEVLERLLSRKTIFALPDMREQFEEQARKNMEAELSSLR